MAPLLLSASIELTATDTFAVLTALLAILAFYTIISIVSNDCIVSINNILSNNRKKHQ